MDPDALDLIVWTLAGAFLLWLWFQVRRLYRLARRGRRHFRSTGH